MAEKICDVCGVENEPGAAFCVSCHSYLAWDETGLTVVGPPTGGRGYPAQPAGGGPSGFTTTSPASTNPDPAAATSGPAANTGPRAQNQPTRTQQRAQFVDADELFQVFSSSPP